MADDLAGEFRSVLRIELERIGAAMVERMQQYLQDRGRVASGELVQSIEYEVDIASEQLIFVARADHGIYVHEGTDPHWPPTGALTGWVQRVGFAQELSIESRDYLARKSVAETGTTATPFIQAPLEANADRIAERLVSTITEALNAEAAR